MPADALNDLAALAGAVKVFIIDDSAIDAELSIMALRRAGIVAEGLVVAGEAQLRSALLFFAPDVILCDFSFPSFDGLEAQRIVREAYPDAPLIFVSGTITEERATLALRAGAVDYVLKSNIDRLPDAVRRALHAAAERQVLESSLDDFEERAHGQAARLAALWQVANNRNLGGEPLVLAMLREGAQAIRPGQPFEGIVARTEGDEVVVFGVRVGVDGEEGASATAGTEAGRRAPLPETFQKDAKRTQSWDDLDTAGHVSDVARRLGWRALISTKFEVGTVRHSLSFASKQPMETPFGADDEVFIELLASSFAYVLEVDQLEQSLRASERRARFHAERLEALWRLANDPNVRDDEMLQFMLERATAAIRQGETFQGNLWCVRDDELLLELTTDVSAAFYADKPAADYAIPLASSVVGKVVAEGGGTRSWDDVQATAYNSPFAVAIAARALVLTTFPAAGKTWALTFSSVEVARKSLGPEERAYVEVVASFFANRLQQRWQFDRIVHYQSHDGLTGLLNRSRFRSQARVSSSACERFALIMVDISRFRDVNETYGPKTGDALLVEVGSALRARASARELVGRVGGDIFGIYVPNPISREFVRCRALEFAEVFARSFSTGDRLGKEFVSLSASVGVSIAPEDGTTMDAIQSRVDAAIFAAKGRGNGAVVFYESGMEEEAHRRSTLRNDLDAAIAGDQFVLYYQPYIEIATGEVSSCEALIRWNHPVRGLLLPAEFIPFAEESGVIKSIDAWVMRNAFVSANELSALRPGFRLFFNLSGRQASDPSLVRAFIRSARDGTDLRCIGVEITETDAMRDAESTRRVCRALRRLGVKIALDDFGTGFSSLSSLKRLPIDIVKVDRSFISGLTSDRHDETIAETIIAICERFDFEVVAEGVQRAEEIAWLRGRSCRYAQGFLICRPLPLAEFKSWLSAGSLREATHSASA